MNRVISSSFPLFLTSLCPFLSPITSHRFYFETPTLVSSGVFLIRFSSRSFRYLVKTAHQKLFFLLKKLIDAPRIADDLKGI